MEEDNKPEVDVLKTNEKENADTTKSIKNVWTTGSIIALIVLSFNTFKAGNLPIISVVIGAIIIVLSINSLNFYNKVIVKLKDSKFGNRLSVVLVYSYLVLLLAVILFPFLFWLSIGLIIISAKAAQLYFYSKRKNFGDKVIKYFRNIAIAYTIFAIFATIFTVYYDYGKLANFFEDPNNSMYQNIYSELDKIEKHGIDTKEIKENINKLYDETVYKNRLNQYSYAILLLFIVFSLTFFIIRMYKSMNYNELYEELRSFYMNHKV